jgi:hypothetical protein
VNGGWVWVAIRVIAALCLLYMCMSALVICSVRGGQGNVLTLQWLLLTQQQPLLLGVAPSPHNTHIHTTHTGQHSHLHGCTICHLASTCAHASGVAFLGPRLGRCGCLHLRRVHGQACQFMLNKHAGQPRAARAGLACGVRGLCQPGCVTVSHGERGRGGGGALA